MKKVVLTLAMLALTSGAAYAQDVNEPTQQDMPARPAANTLDKALIANEKKINEAVAKGDKASFSALVSPTSISADANGFAEGSVVRAGISEGWPSLIASLKTLLETGQPLAFA